MARLLVTDPRDPAGEAELPVHFRVRSPGWRPRRYAGHFDPGCGPEIELRFALDAGNADVLPALTRDQLAAIEAEIAARLDLRSDAHRARPPPA